MPSGRVSSSTDAGVDQPRALGDGQPLYFEIWDDNYLNDSFIGGFVVYPTARMPGPAPTASDWPIIRRGSSGTGGILNRFPVQATLGSGYDSHGGKFRPMTWRRRRQGDESAKRDTLRCFRMRCPRSHRVQPRSWGRNGPYESDLAGEARRRDACERQPVAKTPTMNSSRSARGGAGRRVSLESVIEPWNRARLSW